VHINADRTTLVLKIKRVIRIKVPIRMKAGLKSRASELVAIDPSDTKVALARELGATVNA